jgi:hypothetical protein
MKAKKSYLVDIRVFDPYDNLVNSFLLSLDKSRPEEVDKLIKAELPQYGEHYWAMATDWKYIGENGLPILNSPCYCLGYGDWEEFNATTIQKFLDIL